MNLAELKTRTQTAIETFEREMLAIADEAAKESPLFDSAEFVSDAKAYAEDLHGTFVPILNRAEIDEQEAADARDIAMYGSDLEQHGTHGGSFYVGGLWR